MRYTAPKRPVGAFLRRQRDGSLWTPDAVREVRFDPRWMVTDHPVEQGMSVTDHIQVQPQTVTLTCIVSENPSGSVLGGRPRVREALRWLRETADAGDLVDIYTHRLGVLRNYALSAAPHGLDRVSRLVFDLELREIRFASVSTIVIDVDDVADDVAAGAPDEVDVGEQPTEATDATAESEEAEAEDQSLLSALLEAL